MRFGTNLGNWCPEAVENSFMGLSGAEFQSVFFTTERTAYV